MGIITNYGYKGFTYVQDLTPPSNSEPGDIWLNQEDKDVYMRNNSSWLKTLELSGGGAGGPGDTGIFGGGYTGSETNVIDYVTILRNKKAIFKKQSIKFPSLTLTK